ncbi:MAG: AAA family ATPase [Clostridiales bacterium]|nr:AAA family ATPase [Clostridiales bacterium]
MINWKKLKNNNMFGATLFFLVFFALAAGVILKKTSTPVTMPYTAFIEAVENKTVAEVVVTEDEQFKYRLVDGEDYILTDNPRNPELKESLLLKGIPVTEGSVFSAKNSMGTALIAIFFIAILLILYRSTNHNQPKHAMALNIQETSAAKQHYMKFDDVAGNAEAKESVQDIVDFIKTPEKYERYGARMPRGIILYGPPGTGKTLMAKAIAGEAGATFYAVSGSDFVQMYVGVGASRIRELFQKARADKKAIIFIDEIDALGKKRSSGPNGGNDEREQTLNALLTEMSGFSSGEGIIIIAATNRLDILDEALLRPGRFDRQVEIGLPDLNARLSILTLYKKDKPMSGQIDLENVARQTVYFSGAMLENLLNEAAIFAAKREADTSSPKILTRRIIR